MKTRIFATPSEPVFNLKEFALPPCLLEESLHILAEENEKSIDSGTERSGLFKDGPPVEFIFRACQQLNLPQTSKYIAVELFDRFMTKHTCELYDVVKASSGKDKYGDWQNVQKRLVQQLPLRAISCIQVASKLISHYKAMTPSKSRRFLSSIGYHYTTASVANSEMRLLETLNFELSMTTPLTFVETLLEVLGINAPNVKVKLIHDICMKVLDVYYMRRKVILKKLCKLNCPVVKNKDLSLLGADYLLLGTAVIAAAANILEKNSGKMIIQQLVLITQIIENDICQFADILVQEIVDMTP